ncbi:MAG: chemotaxis response regulator protein-glutamate methylesterase, partial [Acidobacteriota bacterium]|nr:chemotaxis response regulator protein-glutamate methylesterase [Acidobacteriota bacterium]
MRVGIVANDHATAETLRSVVLSAESTAAAWTAVSGSETLALCLRDPVDVVLLDMGLHEPVPALVGRLRRETATTILLATAAERSYAPEVFEALRLGAVDAVVAPVAGGDTCAGARELVEKLGRVRRLLEVPRRRRRRGAPAAVAPPLVILGASTGGPQALATVLGALPRDLPAPVVVVQHLDAEFTDGMIEWLGSATSLEVVPAVTGARPEPGGVWVATGNAHVTLGADGTFLTSAEPEELPYRPSVDVFCRSAAHHWTGLGVAVLLTGLGRDGGAGLLALRHAGWHTIAQD